MFQTFDEKTNSTLDGPRIVQFRHELSKHGLDGFIVPHADEHQNEYLPPYAERLSWLTGFTGSAGLAIVTQHKAAIFVDGRYTLQIKAQVDLETFEINHLIENPPHKWIGTSLEAKTKLGFDPRLHTVDGFQTLKKACDKASIDLVRCQVNPIDAIWSDQPSLPQGLVVPHELSYAGVSSSAKRNEIAEKLREADVAATVLTSPPSIAWLLNIRGQDVSHSPLPICDAILKDTGEVDLFIEPAKLSAGLVTHLGNGVRLEPPNAFEKALDSLGRKKRRVQIDPAAASVWTSDQLKEAGATIVHDRDPCLIPKSIKNDVELDGARAAHKRDGAALCKFLFWLSQEAPKEIIDEIGATKRLEAFRAESGAMQDLSFDTIMGSGPNGAIIHYRVTTKTTRVMKAGELLLVDSGAQYLDGTTDVTRTIAIGRPSEDMRRNFTRVLKGHIAIARARFPANTTGATLDVLARQALWSAGLDYDHGTGHGVGSYLSVHEGPQGISRFSTTVSLKAGMILSNEPGYYRTGQYGIRIENLIVVRPAEAIEGGEREMHSFETLTLAPVDLSLVDQSLLHEDEIDWLNEYHDRVREEIVPLVDAGTASWIRAATRKI